MSAGGAHQRTDREIRLHQLVSRIAVTPASTLPTDVRRLAASSAASVGPCETLRERALHTALCWIAAAPDSITLIEIRSYASSCLTQLDSTVKRLEYWVEYCERRITNGTAGRALA